ncbi:MAG: glycine cleavage system protein GcvH [Ignavibacterium sp.]|nr:MAG: glycine cleavage system protein GcvH [Ignavibacterium sp.]
MNIPDNLKYTNDHEWISIDGNVATIGITDYAQGELGDIVYVDIDADLTEIEKGQSVGTIEAVKTVSDLFGPLTGKVVEMNNALADSPELINTDPYGDGWMLKVEFTNASELDDLLDSAGYKNLLGQ